MTLVIVLWLAVLYCVTLVQNCQKEDLMLDFVVSVGLPVLIAALLVTVAASVQFFYGWQKVFDGFFTGLGSFLNWFFRKGYQPNATPLHSRLNKMVWQQPRVRPGYLWWKSCMAGIPILTGALVVLR